MESPETPPSPAAIQNHHDDNPNPKSCATNTNNSNNPNENTALVKNNTATNPPKNDSKKQNSHQDTSKNNKNDNGNNNTAPNISTGNEKNMVYNRRIAHATTATVINNRFTTKCTLDIRPEKPNSIINSSKIHQKIFEAIKNIDESVAIITHENKRITNSNTFPTDNEHNITFPNQRICKITKRVYISFTLESELTLSQIKYGSRYSSSEGIIETLRANLAFLKMEKYNSQKEASIGFFLGVNPKLTLRKALKQKIDEICLWLDLDDEDTKTLIRETTKESITTQELVIPAFDIHNKEFGSGTGNERITSNVYEIRTSPDNAAILKSILCKASHPDNHPTIQFIPYGIQGITNKDIYKTIIKKQNAFIADSSIIPIYDIEERDIHKFKKLIETAMYIQDIEVTHESTTKGKYFLITTKSDYKKASSEAKDMLKYIYPNRINTNTQYISPQYESPIIHNNVSTYAQALMHFHESNPVPDTSSHKRLKLQFNEKPNPTKRTFPNDTPQTLHNKNETKSVTSISSRSRSEAKSVTFDDEEEPNSSFQQRLKQFGTPPQVISPTNHQTFSNGYASSLQHSIAGRGNGAFARYGGGRGRGKGRGGRGYSEYRDNTKSTTTLETQEDITLSDSEKSEDWKEQVTGMMKDLRTTIMIDVQKIMNENMKVLMKNMAVSIKQNIVETMNILSLIHISEPTRR